MKKYKKSILIILCIIILNTYLTANIDAIEGNTIIAEESITTEFKYSLEPGTEKWAQLNHGERVLALQIPEEILENMKTNDLVTVVLDYPCMVDMIFYDTYQGGFEAVRDHFNGLQELLNREDAGTCLLNAYKNVNVNQLLNMNDENKKFEKSLDLFYLETILAQSEISEKMSDEEMKELLSLAQRNYQIQLENEQKSVSLTLSAYYNSLAEQQGLDYESYVRTPNNSIVRVIVRRGTDTAHIARNKIKEIIEEQYPGAIVVGDATIKYNCHAFAWAGSSTVWMNDPSTYWTDGSYRLVATNAPTALSQKAYYSGYGKEHSGVVVSLTGNQIKSKWGEQSLVLHSIGNCPYFFIPLEVEFYGRS